MLRTSAAALKFAADREFSPRSYHSFFYGQLGGISIDTIHAKNLQHGRYTLSFSFLSARADIMPAVAAHHYDLRAGR
jgi:hypothetical protein